MGGFAFDKLTPLHSKIKKWDFQRWRRHDPTTNPSPRPVCRFAKGEVYIIGLWFPPSGQSLSRSCSAICFHFILCSVVTTSAPSFVVALPLTLDSIQCGFYHPVSSYTLLGVRVSLAADISTHHSGMVPAVCRGDRCVCLSLSVVIDITMSSELLILAFEVWGRGRWRQQPWREKSWVKWIKSNLAWFG